MGTFYHATTAEAAAAILLSGFVDGRNNWGFGEVDLSGVWLSETPLAVMEGVKGDYLLAVDFPDDCLLDDFEVVEEGKPYREWLVPADLIHTRGAVRLVGPSSVDDDDRFAGPVFGDDRTV